MSKQQKEFEEQVRLLTKELRAYATGIIDGNISRVLVAGAQ